jgi:nucleolar complex protein 3
MSKFKQRHMDVEDGMRPTFTPGWHQSLDMEDSLPIKVKGKVIRTVRVKASFDEEEEEEEEEEAQEYKEENDEEEEHIPDEPMFRKDGRTAALMRYDANEDDIKLEIADICQSIQANPHRALVRGDDDGELKSSRRISELYKLMEDHPSIHVSELAMLSALLLLKDICPGYYIRPQQEPEGVTLKKETKKLLDFDRSLLKAYHRLLRFLEKQIDSLGACEEDLVWTAQKRFGLSALRCVCELLRALPFFNFRSQLLKVVVHRGSLPCHVVAKLCTDTLVTVFKNDVNGEVSYEAVRLVATLLVNNKYQVSALFLGCLEYVKLTVHADEGKDVRKKVKKEMRKRKRADDDVLDGLAEADITSDRLSSQRFQADSLHEVCLIYFRYFYC